MSVDPERADIFSFWRDARSAFSRTDKTLSLLRGSIGTVGLRAAGIVVRLASGIVLAQALGATGYGIYAYAIAWLASLTLPSTLGLDQVALRYASAYHETGQWGAIKGVLRYAFFIAGVGSTLVAILSIGVVYAVPGIDSVMRLTLAITLGLLPIVVLTQVRQAALRAFDHTVLAQIPELLNPILLVLLVGIPLAMKWPRMPVPQVALINGAAWAGAFAIGAALLAQRVPREARAATPVYYTPEWRKMIGPLVFFGGAYHLVSRADVLILGVFRSSAEVGVYTVASRVAELMLFAYDALTMAGAGLLARIYASGDRIELQRFTTLIAKSILWLSLPAWLVVLAMAPWLLRVFGPEFEAGATVLRLLATTFFVSSLGGIIIPKLYATGRQRDVAVVTGLVGLLNVALSFLLIPSYGMMGAAIASGTTVLLLKGSLVVVLYRREGILSLPFAMARKDAPQPPA